MEAKDVNSGAMRSSTLFEGGGLRIGLFDLGPAHACWDEVNVMPEHPHITFNLVPTRIRLDGHEGVTPNPSQIVLYNGRHEYTRQRVGDQGSACVWFELSPETITSLAPTCAALDGDAPFAPFAAPQRPCPARQYLTHRAIVARSRSSNADPVAIEEAALNLAASLLADGRRTADRLPARPETRRAHARIVANALEFMASAFSDRLLLAHVARAAHASPFHLARLFRAETGMTIAQCLERIRLAHALHALPERRGGLAGLAREVGFADQAQLTKAFSRRLGVPPGRLARHGLETLAHTNEPPRRPRAALAVRAGGARAVRKN